MKHKFKTILLLLFICLSLRLIPAGLLAAEHHGKVQFGGLPVPGVTVVATQGDKKLAAITDQLGAYSFPDLPDGSWTIEVEMLGFSPIKQDVTVVADTAAPDFELKMQALADMNAQTSAPVAAGISVAPAEAKPAATTGPQRAPARNGKNAPPANAQAGFQRTDVKAAANAPAANTPAPSTDAPPQPGNDAAQSSADLSQRASDGFLINGSSVNGASSAFALNPALGNNRRGQRSLYNGNLGFTLDNSSLDARQYSITGQDTIKPAYNKFTGMASFGGPLKIPHLFRNGPNFVLNYQWTRNRNATTVPGLVPTAAERLGDFSQVLNPLGQQPVSIIDPTTGTQFLNNVIPSYRISPQARALLNLYPLPNFNGNTRYNYQLPLVSPTHQDGFQARLQRAVGRKNQLSGTFAFQSTRGDNPNLLGFLDTNKIFGINTNISWRHTFTPRFYGTFGYQYSRQSIRVLSNFENRVNISGQAGITGNNQEPVNWGPPGLSFVGSGIQSLSDAQASFNRNQTGTVTYDSTWNHGRHNIQFGGDFRRQQFNTLSQQDPRGTFTFTNSTAGYDFAGFLLGIPDASSIAFGNADKYFRASGFDAYVTDDWRMSPGFTLNAGLRWEYGSPITELYGRLVNLDIAPGFTGEVPVVAYHPIGTLTGQKYSDSLVQPDKHAFQPRIGISWRPISGSSMVVRAGYGVYYNTSVYQAIALQMAQQSPLSKSLTVPNTPADPLTLANGFIASPLVTPNSFAIDPNFRVGYSQNWQVSVQRDLPASLQMTATYLGIKGTRGMQAFMPNTVPPGAVNPCLTCPSGFTYLTSNGNSTRESGMLQMRRRLHNGFTATLQYTYAKSIDDAAALGGQGGGRTYAQNWLDLRGERSRSSFDQRHLLSLQGQYTSGMGIGGGSLMRGWRGTAFKEWTFTSQITAGTGLPLTPIYSTVVPGTGVPGIRPDYTGISVYDAKPGFFLNPLAYVKPAPGQWGNAGRNSIAGPSQFNFGASMSRTFRVNDRISVDLRVDAVNVLNHVTYPSWNTNITSSQFGLANSANQMRNLQTTVRMRF